MRIALRILPKLLLGLLGAGGAVAPLSHADEASAPTQTAAAVAQSDAPQQRGMLYRIRFQDHTGYVLGTIHVGKAEFFPLEGEVKKDFSEADSFLLDLDTRDKQPMQGAVKKYAMYPDNDSLDKHLSPSTMTLLKEVLEQDKIPLDIVNHMKPWMAANVLTAVTLERNGYRKAQAADTYFLNAAIAQRKPIDGVSSPDDQLGRFAGMPDKQQEQYLRENLLDLQTGAALRKTQELVEAWATADQKAFDKLSKEMKEDHSAKGNFQREVLQAQRNPVFAAKIAAHLKQDKISFSCLDVVNLIGNKSVPQLLAQSGFEVTRVY